LPRDPLWVEHKLDEIDASRVERLREVGRGIALALTTLPKLLLGAAGARERPLPAWMSSRAESSFSAWAPGAVKVAVRLREDAVGVLERVLREAPLRIGHQVAVFDVWFDGVGRDGSIRVLLGSELLGDLEPAPARGVAERMLAAERLGVGARASATLARARHLKPPYLLVVDVAPEGVPPGAPRPAGR
jgi:hypothetical protein